MEEETPPFKKPMRRSHYHVYDADVRLQMAKSAVSRGIAATCRKFSAELKHDVPMSTVKSIKNAYLQRVAEEVDPSRVKTLEKGP